MIGKNIQTQRKKCKLSQQDLADLVGVSERQIRRYEHEETELTINQLMRIATILGIDYISLLKE